MDLLVVCQSAFFSHYCRGFCRFILCINWLLLWAKSLWSSCQMLLLRSLVPNPPNDDCNSTFSLFVGYTDNFPSSLGIFSFLGSCARCLVVPFSELSAFRSFNDCNYLRSHGLSLNGGLLDGSTHPYWNYSLPSVPKKVFSKVVFTHSCCIHSLVGIGIA